MAKITTQPGSTIVANTPVISNGKWKPLDEKQKARTKFLKYYTREQMRPMTNEDGTPMQNFDQLAMVGAYIEERGIKNEWANLAKVDPEVKNILDMAQKARAMQKQNQWTPVNIIKGV